MRTHSPPPTKATFSSLMSCGEQMWPFPICSGKIIGRDRSVTSCADWESAHQNHFAPNCHFRLINAHIRTRWARERRMKYKTREQRVRRGLAHTSFPFRRRRFSRPETSCVTFLMDVWRGGVITGRFHQERTRVDRSFERKRSVIQLLRLRKH